MSNIWKLHEDSIKNGSACTSKVQRAVKKMLLLKIIGMFC